MPDFPIDDARRPGMLPLGRVRLTDEAAARLARAFQVCSLKPVVRHGEPNVLVSFDLVFAAAGDGRRRVVGVTESERRGQLTGQLVASVADPERYSRSDEYAAWVDALAARLERAERLEAACERLRRAVEDEGRNPDFHRLVLREVFGRWPTLAKAVDGALAALRR